MASIETTATPHLAEQFDELPQQREAATLGMWAFLATEVLFFGALFTSFYVYRVHHHAAFVDGAKDLKHWLGCINTAVLLGSSLTVALAVHHAHHGRRRPLLLMLLATMVLGVAFLAIKGTEYYLEYRDGLVPGFHWNPAEPLPAAAKLFFSFYFIMTAIHATHMLVGLGVFTVLTVQTYRGRYSPEYYNPVEIGGLYWHFVDLVWIFLFPTLYLLRS